MTEKNPLQHRKVGRIRHWYTMWRFNNQALRAQRHRDDEINALIKAGHKAERKAKRESRNHD